MTDVCLLLSYSQYGLYSHTVRFVCAHCTAGIGGGTDQDGGIKATTADEAARLPFFGIQTYPYKKASDPFTTPAVAGYRDYYYAQVANYLQGECNSTKPYAEQTDEVFIWNLLYVVGCV